MNKTKEIAALTEAIELIGEDPANACEELDEVVQQVKQLDKLSVLEFENVADEIRLKLFIFFQIIV